MKTIDYYYSTRSNFTLLGAARLNTLAKAFNRKIIHRPILLSVTMKPLGAIPFDERPAILRNYAMRDALRTAAHLGIPLLREPVHHMGPVELPSGIVIAGQNAVNRGEAGERQTSRIAAGAALLSLLLVLLIDGFAAGGGRAGRGGRVCRPQGPDCRSHERSKPGRADAQLHRGHHSRRYWCAHLLCR